MRCLPSLAVLLCVGLSSSLVQAQTIVIDPGHGGRDPGAVGCGLEEEDIVLDVSLKLRDLLQRAGLTVRMTRDDDTFVTLTGRSDFANGIGASRFVSIHSNASTPAATGTETFSHTSGSANSRNLRDNIQRELIAAWGLRDRGGKTANFSVLRRTSMPAALSELAFTNRCDPDARLLGSPAARTSAAEAHYRAIMRNLGRSTDLPGRTPEPPPAPMPPPSSGTGNMIGVVFEDTVGFEDTSRRLEGARVTVRGSTAAGTTNSTGTFTIDSPTGGQTIEVSLAGYITNTRTCTVARSGDSWCSIGLRRAAPTPPPPAAGGSCTHTYGGSFIDGGCTSGYRCDAGRWRVRTSSDSCACVETTGRVGCDGPAAPAPAPPAPAPEPEPESGCECTVADVEGDATDRDGAWTHSGCSVGGTSSPSGWMVFGLLMLVSLRRRRRMNLALSACACLALVVGCTDEEPTNTAAALDVDPIELPAEVDKLLELSEVETIALGEYLSPRIAPSGDRVALPHPGMSGLSIVELSTNELVDVANTPNSGLNPVWSDDGQRLGYRSVDQNGTATPTHTYALDGNETPVGHTPVRAFVSGDKIVVVDSLTGKREEIAPPGDRYFAPMLSPDLRFVAFRGLSTGLYLMRREDGRVFHLGGEHLSFDPDGQFMVFEQLDDDGHNVTGGDLYITDLKTTNLDTAPLTQSDEIERYPSIAHGRLVFQVGDEIRIGQLR